ncbi:hypothetical protein Q5P01_000568 [Channa striata]|uniref:Uncharacterized protein n=1 Tax=Channa striata TaxID=64152 RepID=A0AA88IDH3_CHASR|nr:hypothetical protein Q5P01_000568 [Channa striata]
MARTLAAQLHAGGTSRSLRGARERRPGRAEAERERDQVPGLQGARGGPLATRRAGPSRQSRGGGVLGPGPSYCGGEIRRPRDSPGYSCPPSPSRRREAGGVTRGVQRCGAPKPTRCWWSWLTPWRSRDSVHGRLGPGRGSHGQREGRSDSETGQQELSRGSGDARLAREELLGRTRESAWLGSSAGDASSRGGRFRALCGVQLGGEGLLPCAQELHEDLAHPGGPRGASFRSEAVDYLYRAASEAPSRGLLG